MKYEMEMWKYADLSELQKYHVKGRHELFDSLNRPHDFTWNLKSFNDLWFCDVCELQPGMKIIEIGSGICYLSQYLHEHSGVDPWVLDKYDSKRQESLLREAGKNDIQELFPKVHYIFDYLGGETNPLPPKSFDIIYSMSVLEHIPSNLMARVFRQMDEALRPGGYLVHAIDIPMPLGVGETLTQKFKSGESQRVEQISGLPFGKLSKKLISSLGDRIERFTFPLVVAQYSVHAINNLLASESKPYLITSAGWAKFLSKILRIENRKMMKRTSLLNTVFDQNLLVEVPEYIFHRWPPFGESKPYWPSLSLLMKMRKIG